MTSPVFSSLEHAAELILEIRGGEGGEDSKLWVHDLFAAYTQYAKSAGFKVKILDSVHGHVTAKITGTDVWKAFRYETGNHCVQRVPPTEKGSRRQTSQVAVAVLPIPPDNVAAKLPPNEVKFTTQVGQGPGGQHRNRTESAVRAVHEPTGLSVWIDGRCQHQNKAEALRILTARVNDEKQKKVNREYAKFRKEQMGDGGRGSKIRTYNFIESRVADHRLGKKTTQIKKIMKGELGLLLD